MAGKGFRLVWNPTVVAGTVSEALSTAGWSIIVNSSAVLQNILVIPPSESTTYKFKITSPTGNVVYNSGDVTGTLNDDKNLMMRGLYTFSITDASIDGAYKFEGMFALKKDK